MFSHASRVVAIVAFLVGVIHFALGFSIVAGWTSDEALIRYAREPATAQLINQSTYVIVFALGLGTLAEIGLAVRKRAATGKE